VIESPDAHGELFDTERLIEVLEKTGDKDLREVKHDVLAAVRAHTGGSLAHDDVTMLAVEIG
jgi:serine phosphatase RsbU (regulator of sigma subunit)